MTKSELRKLYLEKRKALTAGEVAEMSLLLADRLFTSFDLAGIRTLHCFISISKFNEVDTSIIFQKVWNDFPNIDTFAPRMDRSIDELEHLPYTDASEMIENSWGIREPAGTKKADPKKIDLVLVPLLCFDERGFRVGYGKGYYDRFLARCRPDCLKIGISFFPPVDRIDDIHAGDIPLNWCVTPERVYRFEAQR